MNSQIERLIKVIDRASDRRRLYIYRLTEKHRIKGCAALTIDQKRDVKKLFKPYFRINTDSHTFYTARTGVFSSQYIPDSLWYAYIEPFYNPRRLAKAIDSKALYSRLLPPPRVVHPLNLAYKINGYWISNEFSPTCISEIIDKANQCEHVFVKLAEDSAGGHGVFHFRVPEDLDKLRNVLQKCSLNVVVQAGLQQHSTLSSLHPSSVNTIRILSHIMLNGEVKIRSVIVRMGRNGSHVDNASSGGLTVGVDESGRLKKVGYDVNGVQYQEHPDTHTKFSNVVIPNYYELLTNIKKMHWFLPQFRLMSWDIAIDKSASPVLIEVNMHSGQLDFHQLNNGPVFGDDTEAVLKEVSINRK